MTIFLRLMKISSFQFVKWVLRMLHYDRIDLSEGTYFAKSDDNKECIIFHYWFFNHGFKF